MYETMLIVDDVDIERELLVELLQDNFTILEASNGKECMETVESCKNNIDVILMDLMMPEMNGFDVLERRQGMDYFKEIPVIVITASGAIDDQVKAFQLGANDFITKPIILDLALSRINNVLASSKRILSLLKESEEFKVKSEFDLMTKLYNKVTTEDKINDILQEHPEELHAMMIIDIDNFKSVNDQQGHQVGDHTLKIIADLIMSHFRKTDVVGRIGGDEFVVGMKNIASEEIARRKAKEIVRLMKYKPNLTIPANVSVSIGLSFSENKLTDYAAMFLKSDEALYLAKKCGKGRMVEYGVEPMDYTKDNRRCIVLCSRGRSECSTVESILDDSVRMVQILDVMEVQKVVQENKIGVILIDVSDTANNGVDEWNYLKQVEELKDLPVVAICKEGNMEQYKEALLSGLVKDVISVPFEIAQLKRRVFSFMK